MEEIGYKLGEIFQWQDDYLGIFAQEKVLGKPAGSDLREKKPTLLLLQTLENLASRERKLMLSLMGKQLSTGELALARDLIRKSGADAWMKSKIFYSSNKLVKFIRSSELNSEAKTTLEGLTALLIERKF